MPFGAVKDMIFNTQNVPLHDQSWSMVSSILGMLTSSEEEVSQEEAANADTSAPVIEHVGGAPRKRARGGDGAGALTSTDFKMATNYVSCVQRLHFTIFRASNLGARLIHLTYSPGGTAKRKIGIVGKGLTFDSGGYNLKAGGGSMIEMMKFDMGGSASTLGAAAAVAQLKPKDVEVHFVIATCENMVSGNPGALHPGDIITAMDGTTIEVNNTDAEGRLTLADALLFCQEKGVTEVVDIATLTGACMVALGQGITGDCLRSSATRYPAFDLPLNSERDWLLASPRFLRTGRLWNTGRTFCAVLLDLDARGFAATRLGHPGFGHTFDHRHGRLPPAKTAPVRWGASDNVENALRNIAVKLQVRGNRGYEGDAGPDVSAGQGVNLDTVDSASEEDLTHVFDAFAEAGSEASSPSSPRRVVQAGSSNPKQKAPPARAESFARMQAEARAKAATTPKAKAKASRDKASESPSSRMSRTSPSPSAPKAKARLQAPGTRAVPKAASKAGSPAATPKATTPRSAASRGSIAPQSAGSGQVKAKPKAVQTKPTTKLQVPSRSSSPSPRSPSSRPIGTPTFPRSPSNASSPGRLERMQAQAASPSSSAASSPFRRIPAKRHSGAERTAPSPAVSASPRSSTSSPFQARPRGSPTRSSPGSSPQRFGGPLGRRPPGLLSDVSSEDGVMVDSPRQEMLLLQQEAVAQLKRQLADEQAKATRREEQVSSALAAAITSLRSNRPQAIASCERLEEENVSLKHRIPELDVQLERERGKSETMEEAMKELEMQVVSLSRKCHLAEEDAARSESMRSQDAQRQEEVSEAVHLHTASLQMEIQLAREEALSLSRRRDELEKTWQQDVHRLQLQAEAFRQENMGVRQWDEAERRLLDEQHRCLELTENLKRLQQEGREELAAERRRMQALREEHSQAAQAVAAERKTSKHLAQQLRYEQEKGTRNGHVEDGLRLLRSFEAWHRRTLQSMRERRLDVDQAKSQELHEAGRKLAVQEGKVKAAFGRASTAESDFASEMFRA
ncbi:pepA [Symbiodinium sp. CCMP2456]|nr:pepA [Symbiodinium sp. CCMP2456]